MSDLTAMARAARENPDDDTLLLAYADCFEENGRPGRAWFIRMGLGVDQDESGATADPVLDLFAGFVFTEAHWKNIAREEGATAYFDRGLIKGVQCGWNWWDKNAPFLLSHEHVPLVRLVGRPPRSTDLDRFPETEFQVTPGPHFYILDGRTPVPAPDMAAYAEWTAQANRDGRRRVGRTEVGGVEVSTVFLGTDHNYGFGDPALFETAVFGPGETDVVRRYATWDEAEAGHAEVVRSLPSALDVIE